MCNIYLDPHRNGVYVTYDNKLRNLIGSVQACSDWIIQISCDDDPTIDSTKEFYGERLFFEYDGKRWEQLSPFYIDIHGIGAILYAYLRDVGLKVTPMDIKKLELKDDVE